MLFSHKSISSRLKLSTLLENYADDYIIGKYGHLRLKYLKNHKKAEYIIMFMNKTLRKHFVETDKQAKIRFEILMKQILEKILLMKT